MYHPSRIWKANDNSDYISKGISSHNRYTLGDQGIVKATVSGVFEDLMFKISEGSDQNWSCPEFAQLAGPAKLSLHNTLILNLVKPLVYTTYFVFWPSFWDK